MNLLGMVLAVILFAVATTYVGWSTIEACKGIYRMFTYKESKNHG